MNSVLHWTDKDKEEILKRFNLTSNHVENIVVRVKEWMQHQPHFTEIAEDALIERIFLTNKFNEEKTKLKLTMYYMIRHLIPEFFCQNPNSPELLKSMDLFYYLPLPNLNGDLNRISLFKVRDPDVTKFDAILFVAYIINISEIRMREDYRYKEIQIYDLKHVKFGHIIKFTPTILKKLTFVMEKLFDSNIVSIHLLNVPSVVESFITIIRGILRGKIEQRIVTHNNFETLKLVIDKNILPVEYGGTCGSLAEISDMWKQKFKEYDPVFEHLRQVKLNMDLLPEKLKVDDNFGVHGNFRTLDID